MANQWWEIKILAETNLEDAIFWRLQEFGCRGTASEQRDTHQTICAYLPQDGIHSLDLAALALRLRQDALSVGLSSPLMQWNPIDEEDWASTWKQYWHPLEVGDRFLVYPAWLDPPEASDRLLLRLDPGAAFGTGTHPSTQLCMESLEMRVTPDSSPIIADIGCGSGILSIAALLAGAQRVFAVDTDPLAVRSTDRNRDINNIEPERLRAEQGSIERLLDSDEAPFDGILCNILAEVIIDLIPQFEDISTPKTWGIISGVLMDQAKPMADTLEQHGWVVATLWRRQDWCCFNIRRS